MIGAPNCNCNAHIGGRSGVRRCLSAVSVGLFTIAGISGLAANEVHSTPTVNVQEQSGIYTVHARFDVPQPPSIVMAVLTDYERIPRFMPDVKSSLILERTRGRVVVEQEAVASLMMFSKRIHLRLEVEEQAGELRFRDICGRSFTRYEGAWLIAQRQDGRTIVTYELNAKPAFSVPEFLLRRLLGRDAKVMIERLRAEIAARTPVLTEATPASAGASFAASRRAH